ncbi:MAG: helix-turn-helix transcriptional regulator [Clostridia bacterium]|nr:helix-turn-helix transcriptional regulator [Clostridia bacterium]
MNFGSTIKSLRTARGMTQEKLAELLSISAQAVSRWECGLAMPDISLLGPIASLFDVTTDHLLGIDVPKKNQEIKDLLDEARTLLEHAHHMEAVCILRTGTKKHPGNEPLLDKLSHALLLAGQNNVSLSNDEKQALYEEAAALSERILESSTDTTYRNAAISRLCILYGHLGTSDKGIEIAQSMPNLYQSREQLLFNLYQGKDKYRHNQKFLQLLLMQLLQQMGSLTSAHEDGKPVYSEDECRQMHEKMIDILDIFFEDGCYGFFGEAYVRNCLDTAGAYAEKQNREQALLYLHRAAEEAIRCDSEYDPARHYTCIMLRGVPFGGIAYNGKENLSKQLLTVMQREKFNFLRNDAKFSAIEAMLEPHARVITLPS